MPRLSNLVICGNTTIFSVFIVLSTPFSLTILVILDVDEQEELELDADEDDELMPIK